MRVPVIRGIIDRRIPVNFHVAPEALEKVLPACRPQLINAWGIAGICLIRLKEIRPRSLPRIVGLSSENAAHRIAVQWDDNDSCRSSVFWFEHQCSFTLQRT